MRRLTLILLAALVFAPGAIAGGTPTTTGGTAVRQTALEADLLHGINDVRRAHGLRPLVASSKLAQAAAQHSREMGTLGYFDHDSYDSTPFWKRIERWYSPKGRKSWSVGENLLYASPDITSSDGLDDWMNSPEHRANLLSRTWREIGLSAIHFDTAPGEYEDGAVTIVTADFGSRS